MIRWIIAERELYKEIYNNLQLLLGNHPGLDLHKYTKLVKQMETMYRMYSRLLEY